MIAMQYSRQHVIELLRRLGYTELADLARRELPDPVDFDQLTAWGLRNGLTRDELVSRMGGSP